MIHRWITTKLILHYTLNFFIIVGVSNFLLEILDIQNNGLLLLLPFFIFSLKIYFDWFKRLKKVKDFIHRADRYTEMLYNNRKAINVLEMSIEKEELTEKQKVTIYLKLGKLYLQENNEEMAEVYFKKAIDTESIELLKGEMLFQIGGFYADICKYANASEAIEKALEIGWRYRNEIRLSKRTIKKVIFIYIKNNEKQKAMKLYNHMLDLHLMKKDKKIEKMLS